MCKNLEDENEHLTLEIQKLKNTIQTIEQESMQAKLIPHYRLAILRARTHAANLMEQINKEKVSYNIIFYIFFYFLFLNI